MISKNQQINKDYWEKNIEGFSGFYDTHSEESIAAPNWFASIYKKIIFPLEKKYMRDRYNYVCAYIDKNVKKGMKVADIGCGSGIYTKRIISRGAFVYAIDYTENALSLTKKNLLPEEAKFSELLLVDITRQKIPVVDLAISIGVLTYIDEADVFFNNVLPNTNLFLFNYLSGNNLLNIFRKNLSLFDVRNYSYHHFQNIDRTLKSYGFEITQKQKLATGFIIDSKR